MSEISSCLYQVMTLLAFIFHPYTLSIIYLLSHNHMYLLLLLSSYLGLVPPALVLWWRFLLASWMLSFALIPISTFCPFLLTDVEAWLSLQSLWQISYNNLLSPRTSECLLFLGVLATSLLLWRSPSLFWTLLVPWSSLGTQFLLPSICISLVWCRGCFPLVTPILPPLFHHAPSLSL